MSGIFRLLLFFRASAWIKWCEPLNCPLATFTAFIDFVFNADAAAAAADAVVVVVGSESVPPFEALKGLQGIFWMETEKNIFFC